MADWLRPVFARTRSSIPTPTGDRASTLSHEDNNDSEDGRLRASSRVSSYIGLHRPSTPPAPPAPDIFPRIPGPEFVYYKPSADQMAETLKVVMMTKSCIALVPIEYNSCILHVLEAYHGLRVELAKRDDEMEELRQIHTKEIKEFEELATQWEFKEKDYNAELKKLEVILSKTDNGMEKVTLARTKSKVHGSQKVAETIGRGVSTIKERNAARNSRGSDVINESDEFPDTLHSGVEKSFEPRIISGFQKRLRNPFSAPLLLERQIRLPSPIPLLTQRISKPDLRAKTPATEPKDVSAPSTPARRTNLTKAQLDAVEKQRGEKEAEMAFDSCTSTADSESRDGSPRGGSRMGSGINLQEKPLPELPTSRAGLKTSLSRHTMFDFPVTNYPQYVTGPEMDLPPTQMGFSFQPGDDSLLARNSSEGVRNLLGVHQRKRSMTADYYVEIPSINIETPGRSNRAASSPLEPPRSRLPTPSRATDSDSYLQREDILRRETSVSSVVTAVRANSGRSSSNVSASGSLQGRQRLERSSGSNDAVTAAVRATQTTPANNNKAKSKYVGKDKRSSDLLSAIAKGKASKHGSRESGSSIEGRKKSISDVSVSVKEITPSAADKRANKGAKNQKKGPSGY